MRSAALSVAVLVISVGVAHAQYGSSGVYYDYTELSVGQGTQFVLIPHGSDAFSQTSPLSVSIPAAFRVLRENKRTVYGNASLTLRDDDLDRGRIVVHIDPEQRDFFQILAAECVYTFTELGATDVEFVGISDHTWTRADVPFMAFVLHAPMWRALQARVTAGLIELPTGELLDPASFYERWDSGDRGLQRNLLGYLENGSLVDQAGVMTLLGSLEVNNAAEAVTALLDSEVASLRLQAIAYLAPLGDDAVLQRLTEMLEGDESSEVRGAVAQALGNSGDAQYAFFELVHRLDGASAETLPEVLTAMGASGDARAVDLVAEYATSDEDGVRGAAIAALLTLGATERLFAVLDNSEGTEATRLELAEQLSESDSTEDRVRALEYRIEVHDGSAALSLLFSLAQEHEDDGSSTVQSAIGRQLEHRDAGVRAESARLLGALATADALPIVATWANGEEDPDVLAALDEAALSILLSLSIGEVRSFAEGGDVFLQRAAYWTLGEMAQDGSADAGTYDTLLQGLSIEEPAVRGAAVLGLASYGSGEALEAILSIAEDGVPQVRADIARGLGLFSAGQGTVTLQQYLNDGDDRVVAAALRALGEREETELLVQVLEQTSASSGRVRAAAAEAAGLMSIGDTEQVVIDTLMGAASDRDVQVRMSAAVALGNFDNDLAVLGLSPLTHDNNPDVQSRAIAALGETGNDSAMRVLSSLLQERDPAVRIHALEALGVLGRTEVVANIETMLASEEDATVQATAQRVIDGLRR
jgi:HEAT repeat protein